MQLSTCECRSLYQRRPFWNLSFSVIFGRNVGHVCAEPGPAEEAFANLRHLDISNNALEGVDATARVQRWMPALQWLYLDRKAYGAAVKPAQHVLVQVIA